MKIPARFTKTAAVFDAAARWEPCDCESSGSEHSADLYHLVNSFLEGEIEGDEMIDDGTLPENEEFGIRSRALDSADLSKLKSLLSVESDRKISRVVEKARRELSGETPPSEFKRLLMGRLRRLGLDAGLCKSKWEKNGRRPSGSYEYIDVNAGGNRYIVEIGLACEFTIARPTAKYSSLLETFPEVFIGKPGDLKEVVSTMCSALKTSMKAAGISLPPWRGLEYMQSKWSAKYRRTTQEVSRLLPEEFLDVNRNSLNCRKAALPRAAGVEGIQNITAAS